MQNIYLTSYDNKLISKMRRDEDAYTVFCDTSLGSFSVNLPRVSEMAGKDIVFKKDNGANTLTINASGEYIESAQTYAISDPNAHIRVVADTQKYRLLVASSIVNGDGRLYIDLTETNERLQVKYRAPSGTIYNVLLEDPNET